MLLQDEQYVVKWLSQYGALPAYTGNPKARLEVENLNWLKQEKQMPDKGVKLHEPQV